MSRYSNVEFIEVRATFRSLSRRELVNMQGVQRCISMAVLVGLLAACGVQTATQPDLFERANVASKVLTQSIAYHSVFGVVQDGEMATMSVDPEDLAMATLESVDILGEPMSNVTFMWPAELGDDLWDLASSLSGNEWEESEAVWTTAITGASTIRDVLIGTAPDLNLLISIRDTLDAAGVSYSDVTLVGITSGNFLLEVDGQYWDVVLQRPLTGAELAGVTDRYMEMVDYNSSPDRIAELEEPWIELEEQQQSAERALDYDLSSLATSSGSLDLGKLSQLHALSETRLGTAEYVEHRRQCILFICWQKFTGNIPSSDTNDQQATQGGTLQRRAYYFASSSPVAFNSIACVTGSPVNDFALLGCAPSAFIGLIGEQYENHNVAVNGYCKNPSANPDCTTAMTLTDFRRWLVEPDGLNGRPRIAEYMGTCVAGTNYEGLTTLSGFTNGIEDFLNQTNTDLTLVWTAGIGGSTGWNQSTAANIIHLEVGVAENPVVVTYWPTAVTAHYSAITEYDIMWGAGVTINVLTIDDSATWQMLGGSWSGQEGVYYFD